MGNFNEDNSVEKLVLLMLGTQGWKHIVPEVLKRQCGNVLVEDMVKNALIRLNPEIAEDSERADCSLVINLALFT